MAEEKNLKAFEKKLGVEFNNPDLLKQAFVHRSYLNENRDFPLDHNERLEFLGDAVLELIVTEYLYLNYPNPEGELTNWRASLVNSRMLNELSNDIGLEPYMYLSRGEQKDTGKARQFIIANAYEALLGAMYLDQGWEVTKQFVTDKLLYKLDHILEHKLYMDPKSKFQEMAQERMGATPTYQVISELGPDHKKEFEVAVYLNDAVAAKGKGFSKQEAQVNAALAGLKVKGWE